MKVSWCSGLWVIWKFAKLHGEESSIVKATVLWLLGYVKVSAISCLELKQSECQARKDTGKHTQKRRYRSTDVEKEAETQGQKLQKRCSQNMVTFILLGIKCEVVECFALQ